MTTQGERNAELATALKPGKIVMCTIMDSEPGGYAVKLSGTDQLGFVPAAAKLNKGSEVSARFLCVHKNRPILSIGAAVENSSVAPAPQSDWVSTRLHKLHLKRGSDLIPPSFEKNSEAQFAMKDRSLDDLIGMLEGTHQNACVKASSEQWCSRSVMLVLRGRVVGSIYTCIELPQTQPTESALQLMVADLQLPTTKAMFYSLPENIIRPLSGLFLGYRLQRNDSFSTSTYMTHIFEWCAQKALTVCMVMSLPKSATTCLIFIHKGTFAGAHHVEPQIFTKEFSYVRELLDLDSTAEIDATVVPEQPDSAPYGIPLRAAVYKYQSA